MRLGVGRRTPRAVFPSCRINASGDLQDLRRATGEFEVNLVGYCIGGTLAASAIAYMAATAHRRIAAATLLTNLLDFSDVGDISVFIDEAQLQLADEHMHRLGYLEGHHMAEAFNLLRENDLIRSVPG